MADRVVVSDNDVSIFREWLAKKPYLPDDEDDHYIKSFIVGAKGSVQKAKLVYDNYYKSAQMLPELFYDFDPLSTRANKFNKLVALCRIPADGYNLIVTRFLSTDSTDFDVAEYFVRHFYNLQIMLWDNILGDGQAVFMIDATGIHLGHFKTINPVIAEKLMSCVVSASPVRIKGVHVLNLPPLFEWAANLFLQLLPEKLKNRVQLHSSLDAIQEIIPRKFLPKDYDGEMETMSELYEKHMDRVKFYRHKMIAQKVMRENELKNRPKSKDTEITGTFRKLVID